MKIRQLLVLACLVVLVPGTARAYNILALATGGYWNSLYDQHFGATKGYGVPGAPGSRYYTMVDSGHLAGADLMAYDVLLVSSGFTDDWVMQPSIEALAALNAKSTDILQFVRSGRGLVAWSEPFPDGSPWGWDWAPVDLVSSGIYHEDLVGVIDPSHPVMEHSTHESLSNWDSSWHGYFESWDSRLDPLARAGDYAADVRTYRALTLAGAYGPYGSGRMVFSMQDPDYHAYQGVPGAQSLIRDALDWSALPSPVPEPGSFVLLIAGAVSLLAWARRRRL